MKHLTVITSACLLMLGGLTVTAQSALPFTFSTGTPARAEDVNANFNALNAAKLGMGTTITGNGTGSTQAQLKLDLDGAFSLQGQPGVGSLPTTGAGTRMMWYPAKSAFRAGGVEGPQWDAANIGVYSWAGGKNNTAAAPYSIALGDQNTVGATAECGMAMGRGNTLFDSSPNYYGGICGTAMGRNNEVYNQMGMAMGYDNVSYGESAVVMGWQSAAGGDYSIALGRRASTRGTNDSNGRLLACHSPQDGAIVLADASTNEWMNAITRNEFAVHAAGGVRLRTNATQTTGCNLVAGSATWICTSDKNQKKNFKDVDVSAVLRKVVEMPVTTWMYKEDTSGGRHMGPTAQDFYKAFKLGDSDRSIGHLDQAGVAYAAIQGLNKKVEAKEQEVRSLKAENKAL